MSCDDNVEIWKIKKLIRTLDLARGSGTSMISLISSTEESNFNNCKNACR